MAKNCTRLTQNFDAGGSGTSFQTASVAPAANSAIIVAVFAFNGTITSISGLGLTWTTKVNGFQYNGADHRLYAFVGYGSPSAGVITINCDDGTFLGWIVDNITGTVNSTPTNANVATGSGTSNAPLATLGSFGNASAGTWGFCVAQDGVAITEGTGFTEVSQNTTLFDWECNSTFRDSNDTTVDNGLSASAAWGQIALEIVNTASGSSSVTVDHAQATFQGQALPWRYTAPLINAQATFQGQNVSLIAGGGQSAAVVHGQASWEGQEIPFIYSVPGEAGEAVWEEQFINFEIRIKGFFADGAWEGQTVNGVANNSRIEQILGAQAVWSGSNVNGVGTGGGAVPGNDMVEDQPLLVRPMVYALTDTDSR